MDKILDEILNSKSSYDLPNRPIYIWLGVLFASSMLWMLKMPGGFAVMSFSIPILAGLCASWKLKKKINLSIVYLGLAVGFGLLIFISLLSFDLIPGLRIYGSGALVLFLIVGLIAGICYYQYANYLIHKHSGIMDYMEISHGPLFSSRMVVGFGYILLLGGLLSYSSGSAGGVFLLGVGGLLSLSRCGVIMDKNKRAFKEYTSYFFIKKGKWLSFDEFPDAAILNLRYSQDAKVGYFHSTNVKSETQTELVILTKTHRTRKLLKTFKSTEEVNKYCEELCKMFELNLTKFSPKISAQTLARRRR